MKKIFIARIVPVVAILLLASAAPLSALDGEWTQYTVENAGLPTDSLTCVAVGPDGAVWAGTDSAGLVKMAGDSVVVYTTEDGLYRNCVYLCVVDAAGTVWFKNDDRHDLMRFDGETFEEVLFVPNEDHPTDAFFTIDLHPNGVNLIVGATNVVEYDGTEWHIMPAGNYEPYNLDIMYDDEGRVWTTGSNMMYFAPPEPAIAMFDTIWHVIKTNDLGVRRFAYDRNDGVWCRCHDGSLRHYALSDSVWSTVPLPEEGTGITELTTEPSGRLWIGSTNGVYVKPVGGEVKGTSLTGCSIREIAVGPDSTVWFATDDGLWSYDPPHNKPSGVGGEAPADFGIDGNYPNPFNPSTTLSFTLDKGGRVTLEVYNITGQKVRTLAADEYFSAGSHDIVWDGCDDAGKRVSSGVYLARISMGGRQAALAMTLLK